MASLSAATSAASPVMMMMAVTMATVPTTTMTIEFTPLPIMVSMIIDGSRHVSDQT